MPENFIFTRIDGLLVLYTIPGEIQQTCPRAFFEGGGGACHGEIEDAYKAFVDCGKCKPGTDCATKNGDKPCRWAAHRKARE